LGRFPQKKERNSEERSGGVNWKERRAGTVRENVSNRWGDISVKRRGRGSYRKIDVSTEGGIIDSEYLQEQT